MKIRIWLYAVTLSGLFACATDQPIGKPADARKRADVSTQLAINYMKRNQFEIAREELEHALRVEPDHSAANHAMAALQDRLGNDGAAEKYYKHAVRSDAENSRAAHDFGTFLCRRGRLRQALQQYENALANPLYRQPEITNLRAGECLVSHGKSEEAEPHLHKALRVNPTLAPALYHMANIHYQRGNYLSARGYIERYFAIASNTPASLLLAYKIENTLQAPEFAEEYAVLLRSKFAGSKEAKELETLTRSRK